jgi:hypothetical protein
METYSKNGRQTNSKENFNVQPNKPMKLKVLTVNTERTTYSSRGQNKPNMA